MGSDLRPLIERRRETRLLARDYGLIPARVRPGFVVEVHDLSRSGLSFETGHRVLPGRLVVFQLAGANPRSLLRGQVVRSSVRTVTATKLLYVAAIVFEQPQSWIEALLLR